MAKVWPPWPRRKLFPFGGLESAGGAEATVEVGLSDKGSAKPLGDLTVARKAPAGAIAMQKDVAGAIAWAIDAKINGS